MRPKPWAGYVVAGVATASAAFAQRAYGLWFDLQPTDLVLFLVPVVLAGWLGGLRCGLFATALSGVVAVAWFIGPAGSFSIANTNDVVRVAVFLAVAAGISFLCHQFHAQRGQAEGRTQDAANHRAVLEQEVADRREADRSSEQRFRAVVEACPSGLLMVDRDQRIVLVSRVAERMFGWAEAELVGRPVDRLVPERFHSNHRVDAAEYLGSPRPRLMGGEREVRGVRRDGTEFPIEVGLNPVDLPDGLFVLASIIDITERKRAEAEVRASEERFRAFMAHAPLAAWVAASDGRGVYTNPGFDQYLGLPPGAFHGRRPDELWPAEIARAYAENNRRVLASGAAVAAEEPYVRADGSPGMAHVVKFPMQGPAGESLVGGVAIDVTERKREQQALAEKTQILETILNSMREAVLGCDADGRVLVLNRAFRELHGLGPDQSLDDQDFTVHEPGSPDPLPYDRLPLVRAMRGDFTDDIEVELVTAEIPERRTMSVSGRSLRGTAGLTGGLIVVRDVSAHKRVEAALRASEERFRLAAAAAGVGVWEWNLRTNRISWNAQMFELYGVAATPDGVVPYEAWSGAVLPEDLPRQVEALRATIDRLGGGSRSFRIRLPDGRCRHIEAAEQVRLNADGRAEWVVGTNLDVTDRVVAADALRDERERFRAFMDNSPAVAYMKDEDGRTVYINEPMRRNFGIRDADWLGKNEYDQFPAAVADAMRANDRAMLAGGQPIRVLETVPASDGTTCIWQVHKFPFTDAAGQRFLAGIAVDVTAESKAEAALRASEERFRCAFEDAPIGVSLTGTDGRWLQVNRSLCNLTGYSEAELLASDFQAITHPDDLVTDLDQLERFLAGTVQSYQTEKRYVHKAGHLVHVHVSVAMVRDDSGAPAYFICHIMDISARKQVEAALRLSEERFRRLVDGVADHAIFMLDPTGHVVSWNPGAQQIKGYTAGEILGRHFSTFYLPEAVAAGHPEHELAVAVAEGRYQEEGVRVRRDGSRFWADVTISCLRDASGRHVGFVKFTHDITPRRQSEERIRASLREKEVLLKEVHHRVKNNLQIISALLHLQAAAVPDPAVRALFEESRGRVKTMALIHERLYRSGDLAGVDLAEYLRQLARDLYRAYRVSQDSVRLDLDVTVPPLPIDVAIPCGLLLNELISNCLSHAFPGGTGGRIAVEFRPASDGTIVLRVADDGVGLPPNFDARRSPSFGLQLIHTLAEQLAGRVDVTTGPGTAMTVTFPAPAEGHP